MNNEERDDMIRNTHDTVIRMSESLNNHVSNCIVHQVPPCEQHKELSKKLWGIAFAVFSALLASAYAILMSGSKVK
jgi:hypothetical protein